MPDIPLLVSCEHDFLIHLVAVPSTARVSDMIAAAASLVVGIHVPNYPSSSVRARKIDQADALPADANVLDAGVTAMDWIHLYFEPDTVGGTRLQ
ncbi:hypothetical protein D3874_19215 [Oleomonas cavernae]|uniref:Uncharacterized protein n=1 Tax=Oleomonas cavernae TaxID=2320859 RepID=A0A418WFP4_9PROT|nr:toluene-4-monooxygenase system B family protein [Oleomonas cavernae]RJF88845.1 hypothetical protein D3874_19215 [Oleomonas cavernae]